MDAEQPTNGEAYRALLRTAVEDDFDALVDALYSALVEGFPDYEASTDHADDIRAAVRHSARLVVTAVFGGNVPASKRSAWQAIGAQRALGGLRRETMAVAPTIAGQRGFDFVLGKTTAIPGPAPLAGVVLREVLACLTTETAKVTEALLAGYDEQRGLDLAESTRPHTALVDGLLHRLWDDRSEITERARRLGVDVTCPHGALLLLSLRDSAADLTTAAEELHRLVPEVLAGACRPSPRPHVVLLVPSVPAATWPKAVRRSRGLAQAHGLTVVAVDPLDLLDLLHPTYRRTLGSLAVVPAVASGPASLTMFDLEYHWLLNRASVEERAAVVRTVLGPIIDTPKARELLALLDALYETREGIAKVAKVLGIHRNTANNRKNLVHALTGLSLDVPADAHRLFTARAFLKVLRASRSGLAAPQDAV